MKGNRRRSLALLYPALAATTFLAGCANDTVAPDPAAGADEAFLGRKQLATLEWNRLALSMIAKHKPNQQAALRGMAYLTLAQYGAADAAQQQAPSPPRYVGRDRGRLGSGAGIPVSGGRGRVRRRGAGAGGRAGAGPAVRIPDRRDVGPSSAVPPAPPALPMLGLFSRSS